MTTPITTITFESAGDQYLELDVDADGMITQARPDWVTAYWRGSQVKDLGNLAIGMHLQFYHGFNKCLRQTQPTIKSITHHGGKHVQQL